MSVRYAVIFEQAEHNRAAYVPDLAGCITTGSNLEETGRNIREAIVTLETRTPHNQTPAA
jgi:predicted RNase H-like HicB family nuclease